MLTDAECPQCGCQDAKQIAGPSRQMAQMEGIDLDRAGTYACMNCGEHYCFEAALQVFAPTAQCPRCKSFRTKVSGHYKTKDKRYHVCFDCKQGFPTRDPAPMINR